MKNKPFAGNATHAYPSVQTRPSPGELLEIEPAESLLVPESTNKKTDILGVDKYSRRLGLAGRAIFLLCLGLFMSSEAIAAKEAQKQPSATTQTSTRSLVLTNQMTLKTDYPWAIKLGDYVVKFPFVAGGNYKSPRVSRTITKFEIQKAGAPFWEVICKRETDLDLDPLSRSICAAKALSVDAKPIGVAMIYRPDGELKSSLVIGHRHFDIDDKEIRTVSKAGRVLMRVEPYSFFEFLGEPKQPRYQLGPKCSEQLGLACEPVALVLALLSPLKLLPPYSAEETRDLDKLDSGSPVEFEVKESKDKADYDSLTKSAIVMNGIDPMLGVSLEHLVNNEMFLNGRNPLTGPIRNAPRNVFVVVDVMSLAFASDQGGIVVDGDSERQVNWFGALGVNYYDFIDVLAFMEISRASTSWGPLSKPCTSTYRSSCRNTRLSSSNYQRYGLRLGATVLRLGDWRLQTGVDGVYKSLFDSVPNSFPKEPDQKTGWGAGLFAGIEYVLLRSRGLPWMTVGAQFRGDLVYISKAKAWTGDTGQRTYLKLIF